MKNLKLFVMSLCAMFVAVISVNAAVVEDLPSLKQCLNGKSEETSCVLANDIDVKNDINVKIKHDVILDLNTHTLKFNEKGNLADSGLTLMSEITLTIKNGTIEQTLDGQNAVYISDGSLKTENLTVNVTGNVVDEDVPYAFGVSGSGEVITLEFSHDTKVNVPNGYGLGVTSHVDASLDGTWETGKTTVVGMEVITDNKGYAPTKTTNVTFVDGNYTSNDNVVAITKGNWTFNKGNFTSKTKDTITIGAIPTNPIALSVKINDGNFVTENETSKPIAAVDLTEFVYGGTFKSPIQQLELDPTYLANTLSSYVDNGVTYVGTQSNVKIADTTNGLVEADKGSAITGQEVTLTVTPNDGYELDTLVVTDAEGNAIEVVDNKFTMPNSEVTVTATFKAIPVEELEKADYTELDEALANAKDIDTSKYTEETVEVLLKAIKEAEALSRELTKDDQATVDNMVKVLNDAVAGLKVPNTSDNIMNVIATSMISLAVIAGGIVLVRKNKFNN